MNKNKFLADFLSKESYWFTKKNSDKQKRIDALFTKRYTNILSTLFTDALVSKTNEELASDIILADQISRHIYRNKPLKKELFTRWAYLKAKNFVANNLDQDLHLPIWVKFLVLLTIRHSNLEPDLRFCRDRARTYNINSTDELVRFERFMRKTQKDLESFKLRAIIPTKIKHDYKLLLDPKSTWIDFSSLDFSKVKESKLYNSLVQKKIKKGVVISLSGGVDSMVVLTLFHQAKIPLVGAHVDFAHRSETPKEAAFVFDYCEYLGIPCYYRRIDEYSRGKHKLISRPEYEVKSRNIRLNFLQRVIIETNSHAAVLGHHTDDTNENVLTNIMKGRSILDLGVFKEFKNTDGILLWRPFLDFSKQDFLNLAHLCKIPYFKNTTPKFSNRSHFRQKFIPDLEKQYGFGVPQLGLQKLAKNSADWYKMIRLHLIDPIIKQVKYTPFGIWVPFHANYELVFWKQIFQIVFHNIGQKSPSQSSITNLISLKENGVSPVNKDTFVIKLEKSWVLFKPSKIEVKYSIVIDAKENSSIDPIESLCLTGEFYFKARYCNKRKKFKKPFSQYPKALIDMFPKDLVLEKDKNCMLYYRI